MSFSARPGEAGRTFNAVRSSEQSTPGHSNAGTKPTCYTCHGATDELTLTCSSCRHNFHAKCVEYKHYEARAILEYYCDSCFKKYGCITIWRMKIGSRRQRCNKISKICEVKAILNHRYNKSGIQYLIEWKGYPLDQATWEWESSCKDAPELVNRYRRNHNLRPKLSFLGKKGLPDRYVFPEYILDKVATLRRTIKLQSTAHVAFMDDQTSELDEKTIYILEHNLHRYAIQRRSRTIYICDGTNRYLLTDGRSHAYVQKRFERYHIFPIRNTFDHRDTCGYAIIMIVLSMLKMDYTGHYHNTTSWLPRWVGDYLSKKFGKIKKN